MLCNSFPIQCILILGKVPLQYHLHFQLIADIINHMCSPELMENIVDLGKKGISVFSV